MRFDLKTPCKNCPFRTDDTRIVFRGRERAEEIAESAYRNGFPCHLSAEYVEDDEYDSGGYYAVENSQHCVGALMMFAKDGNDTWPGIDNDEDLIANLYDRLDWNAPVFDTEQDFIDANADPRFDL